MLNQCDYGAVRITKGKHAGKLGYYDDDYSNTIAIVYLGMPFKSEPAHVMLFSMEPAEEFEPLTKFCVDYPQAAKQLRLSPRRN